MYCVGAVSHVTAARSVLYMYICDTRCICIVYTWVCTVNVLFWSFILDIMFGSIYVKVCIVNVLFWSFIHDIIFGSLYVKVCTVNILFWSCILDIMFGSIYVYMSLNSYIQIEKMMSWTCLNSNWNMGPLTFTMS
jgi:hypothetical protein